MRRVCRCALIACFCTRAMPGHTLLCFVFCVLLPDCADAEDSSCDIEPYGEEVNDIPIDSWRYAAVFLGKQWCFVCPVAPWARLSRAHALPTVRAQPWP